MQNGMSRYGTSSIRDIINRMHRHHPALDGTALTTIAKYAYQSHGNERYAVRARMSPLLILYCYNKTIMPRTPFHWTMYWRMM